MFHLFATRVLGLLAGLLALPALLATAAAAQSGGAAAVTLYSGENYAGGSKTWALAAGQPYLTVSDIGADMGGQVASLKVGGEVGVLLFGLPHFAAKDRACGPQIGSDARPDLWWQGLTATALPADPAGGSGLALAESKLPETGYGSLILYRRDQGPPPGGLLMERRSYVNYDCGSTLHESYFNRLFVPAAGSAQGSTCVNAALLASRAGGGSNPPTFRRASQLLLLRPARLADGYGAARHRIEVRLFDSENCQGNSVTFPRGGDAGERFHLGDYAFRNKTRSIQVAYLGGAFADYLGPVEAAPQALSAAAPAAPAAAATSAAAATAASAATAGSATTSVGSSATSAASVSSSGASAAGLQSTPSSQAAQPAVTTTTAATTQPAQQPQQPQPAPVQTPPAAVPEQAAAATQPAPSPAPVAPGSRRFQFPVHDEYRLNFCLRSGGEDCGEPAAKAWCQTQGFSGVKSWKKELHTGALFPTIILGEERVCNRYLCDGFEEIICGS